jgi:hypothetical protein
MTLKIEQSFEGGIPVLRLSGRIQVGHLEALEVQIGDRAGVVLDLTEVTLVDVDSVRFLNASEAKGIRLRNCPAYVREWIRRELGPPGSPG